MAHAEEKIIENKGRTWLPHGIVERGRENIGKFREKKEESKNQKLQYFDKQNFIWYNNVFYMILILVSGLFIRNQIKIK